MVPSPRAYARNGAPRRWLGDNDKLNVDLLGGKINIWTIANDWPYRIIHSFYCFDFVIYVHILVITVYSYF
jgi:hypothetical protein